MAIFKRKYRDDTGKKQSTSKYYIKFADHHGTRRQLPAYESKRPSELLLSRIEELVSYRAAGQAPDTALQNWIDGLPQAVVDKLRKWDIVSGGRQSAGVLVMQHIKDFRQSLVDKDTSQQHLKTALPRIEKVITGCRIVSIADITPEKINRYISDLQVSQQTRKHYTVTLKQFSRWLHHTGRTSKDLLAVMDIPKVSKTVVNRRALTPDEAARLLEAAKNSPRDYRGISGYERYLIYSVALNTGLRAGEIRTLKVADINFIGHSIKLKAHNAKSRKAATLPISKELSEQLREFTAKKMPTAAALKTPLKPSGMLKIDLEAAAVEFKTEQGQADFHALRHTFGTWLAQGGTTPQVAQRLMRHSDPRLTQNIYTHIDINDLREGTANLPELKERKSRQAATGTVDISSNLLDTNIDTKFAPRCDNLRNTADNKPFYESGILKAKNPAYDTENAVFSIISRGKNKQATVGFEPTNTGFANRRQEITSTDKASTYEQSKNHLTPPLTPKRAPEHKKEPVFDTQIDPDLKAIIDRWQDLPEHIRQTIKTLAEVK